MIQKEVENNINFEILYRYKGNHVNQKEKKRRRMLLTEKDRDKLKELVNRTLSIIQYDDKITPSSRL